MLLDNKIALVTGASRGIGKAIAIALAKAGATVVINYAGNANAAQEVATEIMENSGKAIVIQADVASAEAVENMVKMIVEQFGRIDILVNNAGITRDNLLMRMKESDWDDVMNTNLKGVYNCTKSISRIMMKQRYGKIVNMTSVVGLTGNAGQANYAAAKAGVIGFTKSVALELGSRNIRCNAIAPGFIETEMTAVLDEKTVQGWRDAIPLKRGGTPEDVANACVFFGSEMSAYVTGQVMNVDGGMLT